MATLVNDESIETKLIQQIFENILSKPNDGNFCRKLIHLLNTTCNAQTDRYEKRKFKSLPNDDLIPLFDAKQYCITQLLTFEYFDVLIQSVANNEDIQALLSILIHGQPMIFVKKVMKHNCLFEESSSLIILSIIDEFVQQRSSLKQESLQTAKNSKLNAFIYDWIRLDFFKCILTMLSLYSFPQSIEFTKHTQTITRIINGILSLCSLRQLNLIKAHKMGHFKIRNNKIFKKEMNQNDDNKQNEIPNNIDLNVLSNLYLDGNESTEQCNILIVGDGDFTFSKALITLWPKIVSKQDKFVKLNLITSTFHNIPTLIKKYFQFDIVNTIYKIQSSASECSVLYGLDATDLSRFYNQCLFDRIIFNFPQTETSVGDHRLKSANQKLIFDFLKSCQPILAKNGSIFVALHINEFKANLLRNGRKDDEIVKMQKCGKRYVEIKAMDMFENDEQVMKVSHDQFFTWNVGEIVKRKELKWLKLKRSIPFHTQWYPGYNVTNVKGQLFDVCRAKIHIFKRAIK